MEARGQRRIGGGRSGKGARRPFARATARTVSPFSASGSTPCAAASIRRSSSSGQRRRARPSSGSKPAPSLSANART